MHPLARSGALFAALTVGACATPPSSYDIAMADYGAEPSDFEAIVKQHMRGLLKDPDSAQFEFQGTPRKGGRTSMFGGVKYGYAICVRINAKNSFGGYVGYRPNLFLIKDGRIIDSLMGDGVYMDGAVNSACSKL